MNRTQQHRTWVAVLLVMATSLGAMAMLALPERTIAQEATKVKAAVPSLARQAEVRKLLEETFELSKANTAAKKQQAAQKLMKMAGDSATAGDELYVVLVTALPLVREAGDFPAYLTAVEQLIETFQVDAEAERTKHLTDFMTARKPSTTPEPVLNEVVEMVGRASRENRYRPANELLTTADKQAKRISATKLSKSLADVRGALREREEAFTARTKGLQTLADKPDDPKANFAVGLWLVIYEDDWEQALPKLALGSDAKWKAASAAEPKSASEIEAQLTAADAWWEAAQSAKGEAKLAAQRRAQEWYERHEPSVKSPLVKARVTKRLEELTASLESASQRTLTLPSQPKPVTNTVSKASKANELPIGKWIDLLEMVKLPEHAEVGEWRRNGETVRCESASGGRFLLPVALRGNYELDCEFTRLSGNETVFMVLPVGTRSCSVLLSGWNGLVSGLHLVDGRECNAIDPSTGAAYRPGTLINDKRYKLRIDVIQDNDRVSVQADLNELRFVAWKGRTSQLSTFVPHMVACPQSIGVGVIGQFVVSKLSLRLKPGGKGYRLADDWLNPIAQVAAVPPKETAAKYIAWKGHKYLLSEKPMTFPEARQLAVELQGRLLTISSAEEEAFLYEQGRGLDLWMSAWRRTESKEWRDERNRPLRFIGTWQANAPRLVDPWFYLVLRTASPNRGMIDSPATGNFHACIEWGEEYPDDK